MILLKSVKIIDIRSKHHRKNRDILIQKGKIMKIAKTIDEPKAKEYSWPNAHVSLGWVDIGTHINDPGREHIENLEDISKAAINGGYSALASFPNTDPCIDKSSLIQYLKRNAEKLSIDILPIGAVTESCKGTDITEMIDMYHSGAVAFSDGSKTISDAGIMIRALQYVKSFDGLVINKASDSNLVKDAFVHEGNISTRMGLKGLPSILEEIQIQRDLKLCEYADSRLLIHKVSSTEGINSLKKNKVVNVDASVSYNNLVFTEEAISSFDNNFKVDPPLRSQKDKKSLIKAINKGEINIIVSDHYAQDQESKNMELAQSSYGNVGLETCFAALNTYLNQNIELDLLIDCMAYNPRKALGMSDNSIEPGQSPSLTIFDPKKTWIYEPGTYKNSPFVSKRFIGKALAVVSKDMVHSSE